jgi:hypothetical protein
VHGETKGDAYANDNKNLNENYSNL